MSRSLPDLQRWHQPILTSEYRARNYPNGITFAEYQKHEVQLVSDIQTLITDQLEPSQQLITNRYYAGSPAHASAWSANWNMSYERVPEQVKGGIILLHGASDSPYSMRALAEVFFEAGLYVIAIRMPGHGTIPGELLNVEVEDWTTLIPMAWARSRQQIGRDKPIYLGGYSAGAAVALDYVLDAVEDELIPQTDGLFMFAPAIGLPGLAAFAYWDDLISQFPGFEKFAWLSVRPEYDPFKYASFPKQVGHLTYSLSTQNQRRVEYLHSTSLWDQMPPVITFQSIVDSTISVPATLDLHQVLPSDRSQLVLFDVNRSNIIKPFLSQDGAATLARLQLPEWGGFDVTIVGNLAESDRVIAERRCGDNPDCISDDTELSSRWPSEVFSLSHIAIPFPPDDPLNGPQGVDQAPDAYNLGNIHTLGERHVLIIPAEDNNRLRYNPFFDYQMQRALMFCSVCNAEAY